MSKKRCELKKGTFIFIGIFILVSAITLVSAARLPTDGGDSGTWGGIMNTFLNVSLNESGELRSGTVSTSQITDDTITDTDISDTTNLTLGEKITFTLGEVIDNIVNGWITITGGLNVTNNLEVNGSAVFYGGNFSVDTSDLFVDVSTGRVGIGTTSPTTALDVEGSVRISGDIVFSDDSTQPYAATPDGFSWQITSASFKQNKSISSQDGNPVGLFFRTDGKKMYMMGGDGIDVNEYNLSTAWDINTSTFNQNFSVSGEDILPKDLFFRPDGKKMYFGGNDNDAIFEYDLSTAWDVSTLSINQNFSVASEETAIRAMFFRSDGFKIYITGNAGDAVYEYNLSTAWDINTSTFNQNFSIATEDGVPVGLFFKPDGKKMYLLGSSDDDINEYDLSTPWDISTAFFNKLFSVQTEDTQPRALFFNPDGSKMYFAGETGDDINEYDMGLVIGGKVGINVTSPTQVLDVGGNVNISGVYYGNGSGLTDIGTSSISDNSITSVKIAADTINGTELADTITLDATMNIISNDFSVNTSDLFVDVSTGRVGIGTTTPSEKLNVSGNIGASGNVTATYFFGNGSQLTDIDGSNIQPDSINGTELADTITLDAAMNFVGQDFAVNTSDLFVDVSTGRIGIGTTTPTQKLDVVGNISVGSYDNIFGTYENVKILNTLESLDTIDGVGTEVLFTFSKMGLFSVGQTYPASTSSSQTISSNKDYGDLTDFSDDEDHLEFFLYISNASAMGSTLVAELGNTQDSAEYQWTLASSQGFPTLADGWNKVVLRMGSASKGSVDWSTGVDHFRIIYTGTGTNPEFNFSIDDLRMTSNRKASVSRDLVLNDALIVFGNVSIGTNSSTEKLTVFGDLNVTGTSYLGDITINADNITVNGIVSKDGNITFYDSSGGEKVRITNDGKMGIGTTSPTQKLDVNGNIKSSESYVFYDGSTQTIASTPNGFSWHVGSASFNQISPNLQSDDQFISGIFFKPDGTKMYITGAGDDEVNEYDLSTIWDISTASLNQILNTSTQGSSPQGIFFKPDGTKMFVVDSGDDEVNEYDLSTAWDISTTSFSRNFNVSSQDTTPRDLFFKPDGTKMYIVGEVNDSVQEYDLSTVWDISTASFNQNFSVATEDANPRGLSFKPDGTKMYVVGASGRDVNEYDLSIPWNISTATFKQLFSVNSQETSPTGVFFRADGTKMYIVGGGSDSVNEYDLGLIINGKVGIGTTSPTTELEVNGTVTVVGDLNVTGTSYLSDVTLTSDNITVNGIVSKDGNITFYDSSGGEKVRITSEGDVGIGTSSPSSLFDVAGDINTLTDYNIGGTQVLSSTALGSGVVSSSLTSVGSLSSLDMGGDISMNNKQIRFNGGSGNNFLQGNVENTGRLGIFTDDTERITILLGGNVGIGTVSPSSKLDVAGDFEVDGSDFFVNASSGRVGIGTTSPSHTLNVVGDLNVTGTSYLGDITITADNITTNGIVSRDGNISFYNNTGGEMVRITESGRVGIGTTTPEATLVVSTSTASVGVLKLQNSNNQADDTWWLGFSHGTDSSDSNDRARIGVNILSGGAGRLVFYTGAGGSQTEQMRIDQDGNVGIGTTSPSSKLEVSGNMTIDSGTLFVDSGNNRVGIGTTAIPHGGIGAAKFAIEGTDASTAGPHIQYTTAADDYPVFQQLNWAHDNVALNFDAYYDGAWKSSDVGSNFQIRKVGDLFRINYDSVVAAGSTVIWSDGITINTTGDVGIGTTDQDTRLHVVDNVASNVMDIVNEATGSSAQGIHIQLGPTSNPGTSNNYLFFKDGDGTKVGDIDGDAAGGVRYQSVSDVRLKENIVDTAYTLEDLLAVQVRDFNFIDGPGPTTTGFIAQELNSIYPLAVAVGSTGDIGDGDNEGEDEIWSIDYGRMTPLIIAGIQELDSKVNTLASGGSLNISIGNQSLNIETLTVSNKTTLFDVIISGLARFKDAVFTGQVSFSEDSVGQAIILEGSTEVQINFKTAYENTPVITLTPLEFIEGQYKLTEKTITGFKIILQNNQSLDIAFDWHAFGQVTENKAEVVNETSEINVTIPEETNKTNETTGESVEQELESEKNITETSKENITEVENSPITGGVINENEQEDNKTPEEIIENATEETNLTISSSIEFKNDSNNLTEEELALLNS